MDLGLVNSQPVFNNSGGWAGANPSRQLSVSSTTGYETKRVVTSLELRFAPTPVPERIQNL